MKIKTVTIIYMVFGLLLILFQWFYWDIIDILTPFLMFIPSIVLLIVTLFLLIYSIVFAIKNTKKVRIRAYVPFTIITVSVMLYIFFPFTKLYLSLNFNMNHNARNDVVEMIKTGQLLPNEKDEHLIMLPERYKGLSKGGGEIMIEDFEDHDAYMFFTFRGVIDNYSGFVYNSDDMAQIELGNEYFEVIKCGDSWYYCASS